MTMPAAVPLQLFTLAFLHSWRLQHSTAHRQNSYGTMLGSAVGPVQDEMMAGVLQSIIKQINFILLAAVCC